jgi:hypothetical protein
MFEEECNNRFGKYGFDMIHFLGVENIHTADELMDSDLPDLAAKAKLRNIKKKNITKLKLWVSELQSLEEGEDEEAPTNEEMDRRVL